MPSALEADDESPTSSVDPSTESNGAWNGDGSSREEVPSDLRERARVAPELATVRTSSDVLPEEPSQTTSGLLDLVGSVSRRALELGLAAREPSFHVFVAARPEVGIENDVLRFAERFAREHAGAQTPPDLVYVHDFERPEAPRALVVPAGVGTKLAETMEGVLDALPEQIAQIGDLEPVREAQLDLAKELEAKNREVLTGLETTAKGLGFGVRPVQGGVQTFPILHGKPLSAEQFEALDEHTKKSLSSAEQRLTREVEKSAALVRDQSQRYQEAQRRALLVAARAVVREAMEPVVAEFAAYAEGLATWLDQVTVALAEDWQDLVTEQEEEKEPSDGDPEHAVRLNRFRVNVLVGHEPGSPPPVLYDTNPTYPHLFGYMERRARFGALLTDFTRIRAGSVQQASGGVLVVRAADVLADPIIWERLKRVLRERERFHRGFDSNQDFYGRGERGGDDRGYDDRGRGCDDYRGHDFNDRGYEDRPGR